MDDPVSINPMLPGPDDLVWAFSALGPVVAYALAAAGIVLLLRRIPDAPAWGGVIPIWNLYLLVKMADWSGLMVVLLFVPGVNVVVTGIGLYRIARFCGSGEYEGIGWGILGALLTPIGLLSLGINAGPYRGPWLGVATDVPGFARSTD